MGIRTYTLCLLTVISLRKLGTSLRTLQRKRLKVRAIDQSKKANVRSTPRNEIERPPQIETVIEPLPVNCTVKDTSRGVDFEKEFIRVLAENGVGRSVSNQLFSVCRSHNIGNFPSDFRKAVGTARKVVVDVMCQGKFHYFGLESGIRRACANFDFNQSRNLHVQVNCDGLPLYKSSAVGFWPILCRVRCRREFSEVFLVGLFCGKGKPASSHEFMQQFVSECLTLGGRICIGGIHCHFQIECFSCDTPARAYLKHCKGHGGYSSCERCEVRGVPVNGKIKFVERSCVKRTDQSFRQARDDSHHHDSVSPLLPLPIDMILDFPLDYMHLVLLGVVRKLMCMWFPKTKKRNKKNSMFHVHLVAGPGLQIANRRALVCAKCCPFEFQRRCRSFNELVYFKATEFRNIVCYLFPFIFEKVFPSDNTFKHFNLLFVSMRLLLTPDLPEELITYARQLLNKFVEEGGSLYGNSFYVNNVHALIHIADDYNRFGNLDNVSCFPFENFMSKLKRYVKRPGDELVQVVKRVKERNDWVKSEIVNKNQAVLNYEHNSGPLGDCSDHCNQYLEVTMLGKRIRVSSNDDVVLTEYGFCCVVNIVQIRSHVYLVVRKYRDVTSAFTYPCDSLKVGVAKCRALAEKLYTVHIRKAVKCLKVVAHDYVYVAKLLHDNF